MSEVFYRLKVKKKKKYWIVVSGLNLSFTKRKNVVIALTLEVKSSVCCLFAITIPLQMGVLNLNEIIPSY